MNDPTIELEATRTALQALQPLDQHQASRALRWLAEILNVDVGLSQGPELPIAVPGSTAEASVVAGTAVGNVAAPSPEDFLAQKRPTSNVERIACLGYYLSEFRQTPHFKVGDITALNTEAAQGRFGNAPRDFKNADGSSGYLAAVSRGVKQVSARGKALVRALPDRDAVQAALREHRRPRKRTSPRKPGNSRDSAPGVGHDESLRSGAGSGESALDLSES